MSEVGLFLAKMSSKKLLSQLLVKELRQELRERGLQLNGNKETLTHRLREALIEEDHDPDEYIFELNPDMTEILKNMQGQMDFVKESLKEINAMNEKINEQMSSMNEKMDQRVNTVENEMEEIKTYVQEQLSKERGTKAIPLVPEISVKIKPPVFDGSISWTVYKRQFEAAAQVNNWDTEEKKATALVLALRGKAAELLQSITNQQDYTAIVKAMELRYGDEHLEEVYRVQLKTRQQRSGETLQELEADIERLAHLAYPTAAQDFLDVFITDAFIDAIRDPELKKAIRISGKRKSSEALVYALSYEAAKDASKNIHHGRRLEVQEEDLTQLLRRVTEVLEERRPSKKQEGQNRTSVRCWNCGEPGHLQRNCTRRFPRQTEYQHRPETDARSGAHGYQGN